MFMKLKAFNKKQNHTTEIKAIDFESGIVKLVKPDSNPIFIYKEKLENIDILEYSGVKLGDVEIYEKDKVSDGVKTYEVVKVPGGFYPFMKPINKNFKKVD